MDDTLPNPVLLFTSVAREIEMVVKDASKLNFKPEDRDINPSSVDKDDFDCALCYRSVVTVSMYV